MNTNLSALERAFQLARSPEISNITDLKRTIRKEGYDESHLEGLSITRQLKAIIRQREFSKSSSV